jgi:aminopeptidase N
MLPMLPRDSGAPLKRRADYRPPVYLVDEVAIEFDLDAEATRVATTLKFRRNPAAVPGDRGKPLVLDGEQQDDVRVELDGVALDATRAELGSGRLTIRDAPASGSLTVRSMIAPARNVALEGLYLSSGVLCTQCESEGFRRITYFPDRPDVLAKYTVTLRAEREHFPVLLSNGNLAGHGELPDGRHYAQWHDPFPKPSYLFALVAGDLTALEDRFVTRSGRDVALAIYSTPRNLKRCHHAMASLKAAMRWDEERFGREYDLDRFMIFCADDFNMGAMENKGLNIFNSRLVLADAATATDEDYQAIEGVVGHEYFHNWTGNRVTCRDWFQLSLKEGLTVFRDQEFSADRGSRTVERIAAVEYLRRDQFAEDAGPMAHPVRPDEYQEINNFYTATVYEKGAEVIRMLHTLLGPERFGRGMDLYFARHDGQAVTCDDFVRSLADASGTDLAQFSRWYSQAGTPVLRASGRYDEATRVYELDVEQSTPPTPGQPVKQPFHIPLAVGLVGPDGRDLPLQLAGEAAPGATTRVLEVRESRERFRFVDLPPGCVPSLLRGFSAPVELAFDYSDRELAFLAAYDSDPVNRWDATQRTFVAAMLWLARERRAGRAMALMPVVEHVVAHLLEDESGDPALIALALMPPDPAYVAAMEAEQDADGVVAARAFLMRELAGRLRVPFEALVARHKPRERYAPTPAQIGRRRLRNVALRYLGALDDAGSRALAAAQYDAADNMTDAIAALAAVRDSDAPDRHDLYARFEARWRDEPLVLDKWFALEATAQRTGTLARVRALLVHPRFNARNPNRVRSLVGSYAHRNFGQFHAADGAGYAFVAEQVIALDASNPQLAASLAGAFNLWRRFPAQRRALMHAALERIRRQPALSSDVAEVAGRALEG